MFSVSVLLPSVSVFYVGLVSFLAVMGGSDQPVSLSHKPKVMNEKHKSVTVVRYRLGLKGRPGSVVTCHGGLYLSG